MKDLRVHFHVDEVKTENSLIKVANLCVRPCLANMILRPGSPFVRRFYQVLARLMQARLIEKWNELNLEQKSAKPSFEILAHETHLLMTIVVILFTGFFTALIVFVCELLFNSYIRKFNLGFNLGFRISIRLI